MSNKIRYIFIIIFLLILSSCSTLRGKSSEADSNDPNVKMAEINLQLGMAYMARKDFSRAKQKLLAATKQAPNLSETWYGLAYFQEITGEKELADQYYLKSVQLAPKRGDTQNNYGTYLCRSGQYQAEIEHFKLAVKDPEYLDIASAYENAGLCALKIPDRKEARKYFTLAEENDPSRITTQKELAQLDIG